MTLSLRVFLPLACASIVALVADVRLAAAGADETQALMKFSDTYLRENGAWRNVHAHASKAVDVQS